MIIVVFVTANPMGKLATNDAHRIVGCDVDSIQLLNAPPSCRRGRQSAIGLQTECAAEHTRNAEVPF